MVSQTDTLREAYEAENLRYIKREAQKQTLEDHVEKVTAEIERLKQDNELCAMAIALLAQTAEQGQEGVTGVFEAIVTPVLQSIFGSGYSLAISWSRGAAQNASAEFRIRTPYGDGDVLEVSPKNKGGVRDVVGFTLRFCFLSLAQNHGPVVLDESFSQLDDERFEGMAAALQFVREKLGYQIIFVTHDKAYIDHADKVVRVSYDDGKSKITQ